MVGNAEEEEEEEEEEEKENQAADMFEGRPDG